VTAQDGAHVVFPATIPWSRGKDHHTETRFDGKVTSAVDDVPRVDPDLAAKRQAFAFMLPHPSLHP
jgi:hypothetical protein